MERNIFLSSDTLVQNIDGVNDWTLENYNTIKSWQNDIKKCVFIYQSHLDQISRKLKITLTISLIAGSLAALSTILNVLLSSLNVKWTSIGFSISAFLCSALVTIVTGIIKLNGWENLILLLSKYVQNLEAAWFNIEIELRITADQRINAKDFIKRMDGEYLFLMRSQPPLTTDEFNNFNLKYQEFNRV